MAKRLLSGNEAIARGAYEYGVSFAAGYPGTPSTEILENIARYKEIHAQWSANEKVAFDEGIGAAIGGLRVLVAMKHVGLNVAADSFMVFPYAGTNGGFIVISADDPGMHSSQNEQDNRYFAKMAKVPLLEPSDPQECKDFLGVGLSLSEEFQLPVMLRTTTRIAHTKGLVEVGERREVPRKEYIRDIKRFSVPIYRHLVRPQLEAKLKKLQELAESSPLNIIEQAVRPQRRQGRSLIGVISSGICYQYAKDVLPEASFFKLGLIYPLPMQKLIDFCQKHQLVYVIEEGEGFLEEQLRAFGITNIVGKELFGNIGEYSPERIEGAIKDSRKSQVEESKGIQIKIKDFGKEIAILPRPPLFCIGCSHRTVFHALRDLDAMVAGDIGCYTMGALPPFESSHTTFCMGASIGNAYGFEQAGIPAVAVIGDSTFIHAGIPALIDVVYNKGKTTVIILDNGTTGMTGGQPHPGVDRTLKGEATKKLDLERLVQAVGVEFVRVVDAWKMLEVKRTIKEAMDFPGPAVVIVRGSCQRLPQMRERYDRSAKYAIDEEICYSCDLCLALRCPAIIRNEGGKPAILALECTACGICTQICPVEAIKQSQVTSQKV